MLMKCLLVSIPKDLLFLWFWNNCVFILNTMYTNSSLFKLSVHFKNFLTNYISVFVLAYYPNTARIGFCSYRNNEKDDWRFSALPVSWFFFFWYTGVVFILKELPNYKSGPQKCLVLAHKIVPLALLGIVPSYAWFTNLQLCNKLLILENNADFHREIMIYKYQVDTYIIV